MSAGRSVPRPPSGTTGPGRPVVWLARHGETEWSRTLRHTGRTDLPLTAEGEAEARALRDPLAAVDFDRVLCSPLSRARETCELAGLGDRVELRDDLLEWDYGDYEGRTSRRHPRRPPRLAALARRLPERRDRRRRRRPRRPHRRRAPRHVRSQRRRRHDRRLRPRPRSPSPLRPLARPPTRRRPALRPRHRHPLPPRLGARLPRHPALERPGLMPHFQLQLPDRSAGTARGTPRCTDSTGAQSSPHFAWAGGEGIKPASISPWQFAQTRTHFARLAAKRRERLASGHVDREALCRWIDVVEMQVDDRSVVPANRARTAAFGDEDALDLLMASGDSLTETALAVPARPAVARCCSWRTPRLRGWRNAGSPPGRVRTGDGGPTAIREKRLRRRFGPWRHVRTYVRTCLGRDRGLAAGRMHAAPLGQLARRRDF